MANVFEEYGLDLIMNQNKISKKQDTSGLGNSSSCNSMNVTDQQLKKIFQILQDDISSNDIVKNNLSTFFPYIRKYVIYAIHKFEKDYMNKLD